MNDNPDPKRFVPTLATGFKDLKIRVESQDKVALPLPHGAKVKIANCMPCQVATNQALAIEELTKFIQNLENKHETQIVSRFEEARRRQVSTCRCL
jgi:hypothetical protein